MPASMFWLQLPHVYTLFVLLPVRYWNSYPVGVVPPCGAYQNRYKPLWIWCISAGEGA